MSHAALDISRIVDTLNAAQGHYRYLLLNPMRQW